MDPVSVVGLVASVVALIDKTIEVVQFLNDVNDAPKEWIAFALEASDLLSILTTLKYTIGEATDDPWFAGIRSLGRKGGPLDQFHQSLAELSQRLKPHSNGIEFKRRLLWSLDKKHINEKLLQLERIKSLINLALSRDSIGLVQAMKAEIGALSATTQQSGNQLQQLHTASQGKLHREFLEWLSPLSYSAKQTDAFSRCQAGSYQWLLVSAEFQDWISKGDSILWGCGMPGAGKTTFTSFLVDELSKSMAASHVQMLYVYFNYKEPAQSPSTIIGALVRQVLEDQVNEPNWLLAKYNSRKHKEAVSLHDLRSFLYEYLGRYSQVYILFDALDEYDEGMGSRSTLFEDLTKLSDRPQTHVMVTSRWLASLQRDLSGSSRIEIRASDSDVEAYVKTQIRASPRMQGHLQQDQSLEGEIIKAVVASCQGMFLLAKLHMDSLATKSSRRNVRQALQTLPSKLDETYLLVFERIQNQNDDDANLAYQLLNWLTYSMRPLKVTEIQHAIALSPGDKTIDGDDLVDPEILLSVCAGIVSIEEQSRVIRLIHYTTEEYLRSIRYTHPKFVEGRVYTTKICATYLGFTDFENGLVPKGFPFYSYAARFWADHANQNAEEASQEEIIKFLIHDGKASAAAQMLGKNYWESTRYGIHLAAHLGAAVSLRNLLAAGADVFRYDSFGRTALHYACEFKQERVVSVLLEHQDVATRPRTTWLALHLAVSHAAKQLVDMILDKYIQDLSGTDPIASAYLGCTPLHRAISADHSSIGSLLFKLPSFADVVDDFGMTALHFASILGKNEAVEALLLGGVSPNLIDKYKCTPLVYAVQVGNVATVRLLLNYGAMITVPQGKSSLVAAAEFGKDELLEVLLTDDLSCINEPDENGWTALHFAAASRRFESIDVLLRKGAATNLCSHDGLTARDVAFYGKMPDSCIPESFSTFKNGTMLPSDEEETVRRQKEPPSHEGEVAVLENFLNENESLIDASTFLQIKEMDDEDERFSQIIMTDFLVQDKQGMFQLGQALFNHDLENVRMIWDFLKSSNATVGMVKAEKLWDQLYDAISLVIKEKNHYGDGTDLHLIGLMRDLIDTHHQNEEFVHKLGKLPFITGDQIDELSHMINRVPESVAQSKQDKERSNDSSSSTLPPRRKSV